MPLLSDIPIFVGIGAAAVALSIAVPALRAHRRRAALRRGRAAAFRVRLAGAGAPYPQSPRWGVLRVTQDGLMWRALGGGLALDLAPVGIKPGVIRAPRRGDRAPQHGVVLAASDGLGTALRLVGYGETIEHVDEVLRERSLPERPAPPVVLAARRRRPLLGPPALLLALAAVGGAFTAWSLSEGVRVTGTVVTGPDADDFCDVRWVDPRDGRTHVNGVTCYEDVGDPVPMIALPEPMRGEVVAAEDPWVWAGISVVIAAVGVGWAVVRRRDRDRDEAAAGVATTAGALVDPPTLTAEQLGYDSVVAAARRRAVAHGWSFDVVAAAERSEPWRIRSAGRLRLLAAVASAWPLAPGVLVGLALGWTAFAGLWASSEATARATATVTDEPMETLPLGPMELQVRFPVRGGASETTLVSVHRLPEPTPKTLAVEYSLNDPDRARALEHDGAPLGASLGAGAFLIGAGFAGWRLRQVLSIRRAERRALDGPVHRVPYVLLPDYGEDASVLLLYVDGPDRRPRLVLMLVEDMTGRIPGMGTIELRGTLDDGEIVVALLDGRQLPTSSALLEADEEDLLALLNDTAPADV